MKFSLTTLNTKFYDTQYYWNNNTLLCHHRRQAFHCRRHRSLASPTRFYLNRLPLCHSPQWRNSARTRLATNRSSLQRSQPAINRHLLHRWLRQQRHRQRHTNSETKRFAISTFAVAKKAISRRTHCRAQQFCQQRLPLLRRWKRILYDLIIQLKLWTLLAQRLVSKVLSEFFHSIDCTLLLSDNYCETNETKPTHRCHQSNNKCITHHKNKQKRCIFGHFGLFFIKSTSLVAYFFVTLDTTKTLPTIRHSSLQT